jgi:hypothetical protein
LKKLAVAFACAFVSTGMAQVGSYLGPGILSPGAGNIGERSGAPVDLRFFVDVSGVYDTGIQPFQVNSKGDLVSVNGLYGEQIDFGVYGVHTFKQAVLGLDFTGNVYHYDNDSTLDGTTENLTLGFTYQKSRRLVFDFRDVAGTSSLGYGSPGFYGVGTGAAGVVNQPTALLFDNRVYYLQSTVDVTFLESARTSFTVGGAGLLVRREASGLAGTNGYNGHGSIQHRLSKTRTIGVEYEYLYFEFPPAYGNSNSNIGQAFFADAIGRHWTYSIHAGAFETNAIGLQQVSLSPVIAALLGTSVGTQRFNRTDVYPNGQATLIGRLKNSSLTFGFGETVVPGNGVYLTSRQQSGSGSYSYTGIRKWNFGATAGYYKLASIGQGIPTYGQFSAGAGITYSLPYAMHIVARYDARHQDIDLAGYRRTGYRVTLGLAYSPGKVPLSLW